MSSSNMSANSCRKIKFEDTIDDSLTHIMKFRGSRLTRPFISEQLLDISETGEDDEEEEDSLSEDNTQDNCPDFTVVGRCLGNHPNMEVNLHQTLNLTKVNDSTFNKTLNETLSNIGKLDWRHQLSTIPKWIAEVWLNRCSKACEDKGIPVQKDPVGNRLPNLINMSMSARPSAIVKRLSSTVHSSSLAPSFLNNSSASGYTTKIRIQQNFQVPGITLPTFSTVADPAHQSVEHWLLVRLNYGKVCIEGKNVRSRLLTRSGPVARVLSPRRIETTDNTVYNLVGALCNDNGSMPSFMEKSFATGFPLNWKSWVKKWHTSTESDDEEDKIADSRQSKPKTSTPRKKQPTSKSTKSKASAESGSNIVGLVSPHKLTRAKARGALNKTPVKKTTEKKGKETKKITKPKTSTSKTAQSSNISPVKPKERRKTTVVAPRCSVTLKKLGSEEILLSGKKKPRSSPKKDSKILTKWRPVLGKAMDELKVAGCLTDSQGKVTEIDHISPLIVKRLDSAQLETEYNVSYILSGPPHLPITHNGIVQMPTDIREKFAQGFPYNWLGVVQLWHAQLKMVNRSPKSLRNGHIANKTSKVNNTRKTQKEVKEDKGKRELEIMSKEIAGVKITTSRRGRRVLKPLKYWENEKLIIDGKKSFCRRGDQYLLLNQSDLQSSEESETEIKTPDIKAKKRKGGSKAEEEQPVRAKKAKVTAKVPVEKAPAKKRAAPVAKNTKADTTTKSRSRASPKNGLKEVAVKVAPVKRTVKPKVPEFEKEEIIKILSNPVSTLSQRSKKEKIMKQMQEKNAHVEQDFFVSGCSGMSSDDELSDAVWDADSVSSKMTTSDDDRMRFNYTPPAARMCLLVSKNTPSPLKLDDPFENASKERDHRTLAFVHRQLSKPKNLLTKKQRNEQKAAAEEAARISKMKYQCSINKEGSILANQLFKEMTSQEISTEKVNNFLRSSPKHKANESDSEVEKYYTDEGDEVDITEL